MPARVSMVSESPSWTSVTCLAGAGAAIAATVLASRSGTVPAPNGINKPRESTPVAASGDGRSFRIVRLLSRARVRPTKPGSNDPCGRGSHSTS